MKRRVLGVIVGVGILFFNVNAQDLPHRANTNFEFFEIESTKEKIADLRAKGTIDFSRQLSSSRFIIRTDQLNSQKFDKKITGINWKFAPGKWDPKQHFKFTIGYSDLDLLKHDLNLIGIRYRIIEERKSSNCAVILIESKQDRDLLFQSPQVTFIDRSDKTPMEETLVNYHDLSVNKVNPIHHNTNLSGEGFAISIREKSFNPNDIDFKGRYYLSTLASSNLSVHANFMATMAAGGGNSAPNSKGCAWKVKVGSSSNEISQLADDPQILIQEGVSAQNHSYGLLILENFYGAEAKSYDDAVFNNPTLLHVFSSGNSGQIRKTESIYGTYDSLETYSTLTGNFKMSKNTLVVGGHYRDYSVDSRNSSGPTYDGRIKPEVVAYGEAGTSDAAAMATGVGVLIQDAYKTSKGINPPVSLIKAALISSADDVGAIGIDHSTGFGAINAAKSVELIQSDQFIEEAILNAESKTFNIDIPSNTKKLKVSLVWTDPAAQPNDAFALVNDLDLSVIDPSDNETLPWVLSSYAKLDSLKAAPKRKKDHFNNVELVTLDNPATGTYQIKVLGTRVIGGGSQAFSVAWSLEEVDTFSWTFPLQDDAIEAAQEVYLRWDNTIEATGTLEMSLDGGGWQLVDDNVSLQNGFLKWLVPDVNSSVNLRMNTGLSIVETGSFIVSKQVPLKVIFNCADNGMIAWKKINEATSYQVSALSDKFLEPVTTLSDTSYMIDKLAIFSDYFAVTPIINTKSAYRSFAYKIDAQGVYCYYTSFYGLPENNSAHLYLNLSTLYNVKQVVLEKQTETGFIPIHTFTTPAMVLDFIDTEIKKGATYYRASIELLSGEVSVTNIASVYYADKNTYFVYPNPVKPGEQLTIFTDGQDLSIIFYKSNGQMLERSELAGTFYTPTIQPQLSPGIFFYRIFRNNNVVATGKLLVSN